MIADILSNKKRNPIVTVLFIRERKLNIFIVFITQSYLTAPKKIEFNTSFCHENFKQKRTSKKLHLITLQILTFKFYESLEKVYCRTIFIFGY